MHNSHFMLHFFQRLASQVWRYRILAALLIVVAIFAAEFSLLKLPKANAAYTIANSARFISGNSDYLSRTPAGAGSQTTWTYSTWVKLGNLTESTIFMAGTISSNDIAVRFVSDNLTFFERTKLDIASSAKFRDPSAWLHVVAVWDTTNATAADRARLYVDGVRVVTVNSTLPALNDTSVFNSATAHNIGRFTNSSRYYDGYMADAYFIDGAALAPTCFGATDANGYWRPITYSTASPCAAYGTNGFKLDFSNSADFGNDVSGGTNDWTNNNLATTDQVTDSPTNSFATLSPIDKESAGTLSTGNLKIVGTASA